MRDFMSKVEKCHKGTILHCARCRLISETGEGYVEKTLKVTW